jgi:DNA recombination protein RmuC
MALRRVVEMAGMVDHVDFVEQLGTDTGDTRLRPDLIVKLPEDRLIAVDAKVPLAAYLQAVEATDEDTRQAKLKEHARLVRTQIQNLGRKSYAEHLEKAPDFVVLFLPMESLFSAALQQDPSLIEAGVDQNVVIATPTTLIGLLRAVAYGWRQERLAASAREISILGRELYERLATFVEHVTALGRGLGQATKAYNAAVGTLESRVLVSARKFDALGVSVSGKSLNGPPQLELLPRELRAAELAPPPGPPASGESLTEPAPHR